MDGYQDISGKILKLSFFPGNLGLKNSDYNNFLLLTVNHAENSAAYWAILQRFRDRVFSPILSSVVCMNRSHSLGNHDSSEETCQSNRKSSFSNLMGDFFYDGRNPLVRFDWKK
jgi:hypothetical protein